MNTKEKIYDLCSSYIRQRMETALSAIASAQAAGEDDTKSSAGDKYETGREMMKQEIERNQQLLADAQQMERTLEGLKPTTMKAADSIGPGSLARTDQGIFYLAIGIGKLIVEDKEVFVLSPAAPVGKLLIGKRPGDAFSCNGKTYHIQELE